MKSHQLTGLIVIFCVIGYQYINLYPLSMWIYSLQLSEERLKSSTYLFGALCDVVSYLGISICLMNEMDNLENFHLDKLSLALFSFSGFGSFYLWHWLIFSEDQLFIVWLLLPCSLLPLFILAKNWKQIPSPNWQWVCIGLVIMSLILIPNSILGYWSLRDTDLPQPVGNTFGEIFALISFSLFTFMVFSPLEDVLFRGFFAGYLRKFNWQERNIFLVQGVLFLFLHPQIWKYPLALFIGLPIFIAANYFIVYRSRQLFPTMAGHIFYNVVLSLLTRIYAL